MIRKRSRPSAAQSFLDLPAPLGECAGLLDRYWTWLKAEIEAPDDLPTPPIAHEKLPLNVKMAFFYPIAGDPGTTMRIVTSRRSLQRAAAVKGLGVLGEPAHELVNYVLLMGENGWDLNRPTFAPAVHDHCDPTFRRLTRHMGTVVWNAYHSANAVRAIDQMVQRSCWENRPSPE